MGDEQLLGEKAVPDGPTILSKDGILSLDMSTTQEDFSKNPLISSKSLFSINNATGHHDQVNSSDPPFLGPNVSFKSSSNTEIFLTAATKTGSLPCHLRSFLQPMVISEGYKWVVLHGGWTLIPCVNTDKFIPQELIPSNTSPEDPIVEELVDWGDDDDQDYLIEDVADEENFLEDDNIHIEALEDLHPVDSDLSQPDNLINDSVEDEMELNGVGNTENRHNSPLLGAQPACLPLLIPASS